MTFTIIFWLALSIIVGVAAHKRCNRDLIARVIT
jgi:hypothetical protein